MTDARYDLRTLSRLAEVTPRTVHFYVQQGLLPPATSAGPGARYEEEHLLRLRLIRRLQRRHLPLAEIRSRLGNLGVEDLETLLGETNGGAGAARPSTALEYIRRVLAEGTDTDSARRPPSAPHSRPKTPSLERSSWERVVLATDVELHLRRPLSRDTNRRVDRLIAAAREIFKEE